MKSISEENKQLFLGLSSLQGVGRKSVVSILEAAKFSLDNFKSMEYGDLEQVLKAQKVPSYLHSSEAISKAKKNGLFLKGEHLYKQIQAKGINLLLKPELPEMLRSIPSSPDFLFVLGNQSILLDGTFVAVVGTRRPTQAGLDSVKHLFSVFDRARGSKIRIVSGLAEGIDGHVHNLALKNGFPNIAFLGCGINVVFPKSTIKIRQGILEDGGLLASEYLPDEMYEKQKFVQRNRLQAGLSQLLIAVQAEKRSGTAHTVRFAQQYDRPVFGLDFGEANPIHEVIGNGGTIIDIKTREGKMLLYDSLMKTLPSGLQLSLLDRAHLGVQD
ncbi:MAG: DNA-processing protein DprA [Candidatus Sericytochromatia bacterium]